MKKEESPAYYPIFLNIRRGKCLVVGGGEVALRKVKTLLEYSAEVKVVSPTLCLELGKLKQDGSIKASKRNYQKSDSNTAILVVAATDDPKINERVAADARQQRVLVNIVDSPEQSDFIVPSHFKRGDIIIAVSTSGKSPALARKMRNKIEEGFRTEYAQLALLISKIRAELKQQSITVDADVWQEALDLDLLINLLQHNKVVEAKNMILKKLKMPGGGNT
jgi:siroheme synthase-like protein